MQWRTVGYLTSNELSCLSVNQARINERQCSLNVIRSAARSCLAAVICRKLSWRYSAGVPCGTALSQP